MLILHLETAPHPQAIEQIRHESGDITVGRGTDADWCIEDPEMFVSRKHCIVSGDPEGYRISDASSGGLFIDGSSRPLGPGNSIALEHDMRIRLGNFVLRVEIAGSKPVGTTLPQTTNASADLSEDAFFEQVGEVSENQVRPKDLPDPFDDNPKPADLSSSAVDTPLFDDVYTLGPGDVSGTASASTQEPSTGFDFDFGPQAVAKMSEQEDQPPETPPSDREAPLQSHPDPEKIRAAFFDGLGLDLESFSTDDPEEQMHALGKRYRLLVDGLFHLLRTRAREKNAARLNMTVLANMDVNPVKFAASTDEALASLITRKAEGYLEPDQAVVESFRDLTEHQIRAWNAIQVALRRMVDQFDPSEFERAMEEHSLLEQLISGGRSAKLWQLYQERYRQIADSAENTFLGEVGADFREAYDGMRRGRHD